MTELVFILDRSGSMAGAVEDTIGGFNSMLDRQKTEAGEALVTTVLFDSRAEFLHDRVRLEQVPHMTKKEYYARGSTALLDAVGSTIRHIAHIHKYAKPEDRPEKTLFIITTDGMENASRRYDYQRVQQMITLEQEKYGWEFIFMGAEIDVVREAKRMGIRDDRALSYSKRNGGVQRMFCVAEDVVSSIRASACVDEEVLDKFRKDERNR